MKRSPTPNAIVEIALKSPFRIITREPMMPSTVAAMTAWVSLIRNMMNETITMAIDVAPLRT